MARLTTDMSDGKSIYFQAFSDLEKHYKMVVQKLAIYENIGEPEELCKKPVLPMGLHGIAVFEEFEVTKSSVSFLSYAPIDPIYLSDALSCKKLVCDSKFSDDNFSYNSDGNYILAPKNLNGKMRILAVYSHFDYAWKIQH